MSGLRGSPALAALLSFLWPGLGQLYGGDRRRAAIFAVPAAVVVAAVGSQFISGLELAAASLIDPSFAFALLVLVVAFGAFRLIALRDAFLGVGDADARTARPARAALVTVVIAIVAMHAIAGYVTWAFYDAGSRIFREPDSGGPVEPGPTASTPIAGATSTASPNDYIAPPAATPPTKFARVTVLLTGVDSGHDRNHALTDTMLVMSIDPTGGGSVMISIPRDVAQFPLYSGGVYNGKINSLMTTARLNPTRYPDGGINTLANQIGYLIGIPVHYTAAINLEGFGRMVNLVGGVDIVNERRIADPTYDWFNGTYGFYLAAGPHHLDGKTALAYVRTRKGAGDNDFTRSGRQQQLLVALRDRMTDPAVLAKLPDLLDAAAKTIQTNFPADRVREFLELSNTVDESTIARYVLGPPYSVHPPTNSTGGIYILRMDLDKVAALSIELFGTDSRYFADTSGPEVQP